MITIIVNGNPQAVEQTTTLADLLLHLQLQDKRIAIELNQEIIPRNAFVTTWLQSNDRVEIVHAIGGG